MALSTIEKTAASIAAVGSVVAMAFGVDARLQAQHQAILEAVNKEAARSELRANIYTINQAVADLTSRSMMYQMKAEAGVITDQESIRWESVRDERDSRIRESERLTGQLNDL